MSKWPIISNVRFLAIKLMFESKVDLSTITDVPWGDDPLKNVWILLQVDQSIVIEIE